MAGEEQDAGAREVEIGAGVVGELGLYRGARRAYFDRLCERALFARALASFLPAGVAELIEASPSALSLEEEIEATVLVSDIRGFSAVAEQLSPRTVTDVIGRPGARQLKGRREPVDVFRIGWEGSA